MSTTIIGTQAAQMLDINKHLWRRTISRMPGFPAPINPGGRPLRYELEAVQRWAAGQTDIRGQFLEVDRQLRNDETPLSTFNKLCLQFAKGVFLPPAQKEALEFKKLIARTTRPHTTRVVLKPDWTID